MTHHTGVWCPSCNGRGVISVLPPGANPFQMSIEAIATAERRNAPCSACNGTGLAEMLGLSVRQPWAHHILFDGKDVENRTWPTKVRGWVALHASAGVDSHDREEVKAKNMTLGAITGLMKITDCVSAMDSKWWIGPYGFVIQAVAPLKTPIPFKGSLGFFTVPVQIVATMRDQLKAAT